MLDWWYSLAPQWVAVLTVFSLLYASFYCFVVKHKLVGVMMIVSSGIAYFIAVDLVDTTQSSLFWLLLGAVAFACLSIAIVAEGSEKETAGIRAFYSLGMFIPSSLLLSTLLWQWQDVSPEQDPAHEVRTLMLDFALTANWLLVVAFIVTGLVILYVRRRRHKRRDDTTLILPADEPPDDSQPPPP